MLKKTKMKKSLEIRRKRRKPSRKSTLRMRS